MKNKDETAGKKKQGRKNPITKSVNSIVDMYKNSNADEREILKITNEGIKQYYDNNQDLTLELLSDRLEYIEFEKSKKIDVFIGVACGVAASMMVAVIIDGDEMIQSFSKKGASVIFFGVIMILMVFFAWIWYRFLDEAVHQYITGFRRTEYRLIFFDYEARLIKEKIRVVYGYDFDGDVPANKGFGIDKTPSSRMMRRKVLIGKRRKTRRRK